ncbi:hypothetical protein SASPL_141693 [Salvia splendens]|uniref:Trichome birefringence-like C-terminal domain-containing protein n=1 Tax=Salvia splendens TaxID=180675 RepID=A0A8X8WJ60_SALSN|nr:hypothetical protein SASPL_141693 [Salvia splendens]
MWPSSSMLLEWTTGRGYTTAVPINVSVDEEIEEGCNVFQGSWIRDNESLPLYGEEDCSFLVKQTTCVDGMKSMEMLRNKRLMFVGDSVQRGMFESMICLVHSALPRVVRRSLHRIPPRKVFQSRDHATNHTVMKRLVKLDSVAKHSKEWEGADVIAMETWANWVDSRINPETQKIFFFATYGVGSGSPGQMGSASTRHTRLKDRTGSNLDIM